MSSTGKGGKPMLWDSHEALAATAGRRETEGGERPTLGAAGWLSLAAAPAFALMALVTGLGGGPAEMLCNAGAGGWMPGGMAPMYLLMSVFHAGPWLKLIVGGSRGAGS